MQISIRHTDMFSIFCWKGISFNQIYVYLSIFWYTFTFTVCPFSIPYFLFQMDLGSKQIHRWPKRHHHHIFLFIWVICVIFSTAIEIWVNNRNGKMRNRMTRCTLHVFDTRKVFLSPSCSNSNKRRPIE